jgi:Mor family transcriptional regulator
VRRINSNNFKSGQLNGIYKEIAVLCGIEVALKMYKQYKGQQITFPTKLLSKEYVENQAFKLYDGTNLKSLSKQFNYTERWLREVIKRYGNKNLDPT